MGTKYGYHPKPSKTVLIVKDHLLASEAKRIFNGTGIKLSLEGERHLGAVLGSDNFRELYVKGKVSKWMKDVEQLSEIAKEEPQAALSAYTKGLCHRWTFLQRTVSGIVSYHILIFHLMVFYLALHLYNVYVLIMYHIQEVLLFYLPSVHLHWRVH